MDTIVIPALIGLFIESVVFYVDTFAVNRVLDWRLIAALVGGVLAAVTFGLDLFTDAGFVTAVPFLGSVFTGVVFGRIANTLHNGIEAINK